MRIVSKIGHYIAFLSLFGACSSLEKSPSDAQAMSTKEAYLGADYSDYVFLKSQLQIYSGQSLEAKNNIENYLQSSAQGASSDSKAALKIMLARILVGNGDYQEAGRVYLELLAKHYENNEALSEVARFFYTIQSHEQALALYNHLIKIEPKNENHLVYAGLISLEMRRYEAGKKFFNKIIQRFPNSKHLGHYYLGELYEDQKKYKSSMWSYDQCNKNAPRNFSACTLGKSKVLEFMGKNDEAVLVLSKFLKKHKDEAVLKKIINLHFSNFDFRSALTYMFELEKLKPYDLDVKRKLGRLLMTSKDYSEALTRFRLISLSKESGDQDHINVIEALKVSNQINQIQNFERTVAKEKDLGESYFIKRRSIVTELDNNYSDLCSYAKKENKADCFHVAGLAYLSDQNTKKAFKTFKKASSYNKKAYKTLYMLGRIYFEENDNQKKGEQNILKALEIEPDFTVALNYMAYTWAKNGVKLNESLNFSQRALSFEPTNGHFLDTFGYVLYKMEEYENALVVFKKAARLVPDNAEIYEHIADVYVGLNRPKDALSFYELASALLKGENLKKLGGKIARFKQENSRALSSESNQNISTAGDNPDAVRVPAAFQEK